MVNPSQNGFVSEEIPPCAARFRVAKRLLSTPQDAPCRFYSSMVRMTPSSTKSSTPPTGASSLQDHKLDLYAVKFVPSWLQRINSLPASQRLYSPLPAYTDFEEYSQSFLPKHHYKTCSSTQFLGQIKHQRYALDTVPDGPQVPLEQLDIRNYATHFRSALIEERRATAEGFKQYNQYQVQLEPFPPQHDRYTLSVPGLRENIPEIFIGDFISIRAIRGSASSLFDGIEYVAYIWAIDRKNVTFSSIDAQVRNTWYCFCPILIARIC